MRQQKHNKNTLNMVDPPIAAAVAAGPPPTLPIPTINNGPTPMAIRLLMMLIRAVKLIVIVPIGINQRAMRAMRAMKAMKSVMNAAMKAA